MLTQRYGTVSATDMKSMDAWWFLLGIAVILRGANATGSCREANLCCDGRDSSCVVQAGKPCYCDHECLKVGDCCTDFQEVCGATDCEVSNWGPWSTCSMVCGIGSMIRERRVIRFPQNGGKTCPALIQERSCPGEQCNEKSDTTASGDAALILPATYSTIRQINSTQDIRSNLRFRNEKTQEESLRKRKYCITFELEKRSKACEKLDRLISQKFEKGHKVCTACERAAQHKHIGYQCKGHGQEQKSTSFTFLTFPQCNGKWKRLNASEDCECNKNKPDFIFV